MSKYYSISDAMKSFSDTEIPIIIPTFNQVTYAEFMKNQLLDLGIENFVFSDNNSTYPPMLKWLEENAKEHRVLHLGYNFGPRIYSESGVIQSMPDWFVVTDPDLIFNKNLPSTFIEDFIEACSYYQFSKFGMAMDISFDASEKFFNREQVLRWESRYWEMPIGAMKNNSTIYFAPIDTTFAVHNTGQIIQELQAGALTTTVRSARAAGDYTCEHMGWWKNQPMTDEEFEYYKSIQTWASTENQKRSMGL